MFRLKGGYWDSITTIIILTYLFLKTIFNYIKYFDNLIAIIVIIIINFLNQNQEFGILFGWKKLFLIRSININLLNLIKFTNFISTSTNFLNSVHWDVIYVIIIIHFKCLLVYFFNLLFSYILRYLRFKIIYCILLFLSKLLV